MYNLAYVTYVLAIHYIANTIIFTYFQFSWVFVICRCIVSHIGISSYPFDYEE